MQVYRKKIIAPHGWVFHTEAMWMAHNEYSQCALASPEQDSVWKFSSVQNK